MTDAREAIDLRVRSVAADDAMLAVSSSSGWPCSAVHTHICTYIGRSTRYSDAVDKSQTGFLRGDFDLGHLAYGVMRYTRICMHRLAHTVRLTIAVCVTSILV